MSKTGFFQASPPDVAISIDADRVAAARLAWRGSIPNVAAYAVEALPSGAVVPALATSNIADVPAVGRAITQALAGVGTRLRRAAVVIPDTAAKVSLIRFEQVPAKGDDLLELVRWQIRKAAPFPIDQAIVSYTPGTRSAEAGQELVVSVARSDIIQQYEAACAHAGVHAGLVDLATFSIINGVLASQGAPVNDWLLVHPTSTYITVAVLRGEHVIFFRNRAEETEGTLADVVHQTAMYYEDRLKGSGFERVILAGSDPSDGELQRSLEERLRVSVEPVDPTTAVAANGIGAEHEVRCTLAPLVGILLRERKAA